MRGGGTIERLERLEELAADLLRTARTPTELATASFGPDFRVPAPTTGPVSTLLALDGCWRVALRDDVNHHAQAYGLASAVARFALWRKCGPARDGDEREADVNYLALALYVPAAALEALRSKCPGVDAELVADAAQRFGVTESALLCRASEVVPVAIAIVLGDGIPFPDRWPTARPLPATGALIRGPWKGPRCEATLRHWTASPPPGIRRISLTDAPRTALIEIAG
jgi:hypothetical protein